MIFWLSNYVRAEHALMVQDFEAMLARFPQKWTRGCATARHSPVEHPARRYVQPARVHLHAASGRSDASRGAAPPRRRGLRAGIDAASMGW